ncbi:MAG: TRAP transporter large permease [Hyphomicrobiaceae bacterium]|nr:TRAP transporter large permease [Hyphomicrobiaceae bacterium]
MSNLELGLWSFPVLLVIIFLRIPIGVAMLVVGVAGNILVLGKPTPILAQLKDISYSTFSNYSLSIIPLFLLMGQLASIGGLSRALFRAAETWVGHRRGGVAMAAVAACAGFGSICGSSLATAATMGHVALPELRRYGYSGRLATGTLAAGGTLGILIPPSVILVIYAILAQQNVAKLFVAAILPGILAVLGYAVAIAIYVRIRPDSAGKREAAPARERFGALVSTWPVLLVFFLVVGGIYFGWFTPTEAAAVGALGTGLIALATGNLSRQNFVDAVLETASATAMIYLIIYGANVFNAFLALSQLPQVAAEFVSLQGLDPWLVLVAMLVVYLIFGCVMDSLSMIILTIPIFFPIVSGLDFGLSPSEFGLWFGILVLIVVEVGLITPPVGLNLFIINKLAPDIPISETFKGVLPFVLSDLVRVVLLTLFPAITLFGVKLLFA